MLVPEEPAMMTSVPNEPIRTPTSQMPNPEEKVVCTFHGAVYTCQTGQSKGWHMLSEGYVPVYVVHSEYTPQMPFKLVAATSAQDGPGVAPCLIFNISMEVRGRRTKTTFLQWHLKGSSDQTNYGLQLVNEEQAVKFENIFNKAIDVAKDAVGVDSRDLERMHRISHLNRTGQHTEAYQLLSSCRPEHMGKTMVKVALPDNQSTMLLLAGSTTLLELLRVVAEKRKLESHCFGIRSAVDGRLYESWELKMMTVNSLGANEVKLENLVNVISENKSKTDQLQLLNAHAQSSRIDKGEEFCFIEVHLPDGGKTMVKLPPTTSMGELLFHIAGKRGIDQHTLDMAENASGKKLYSMIGNISQNKVKEVYLVPKLLPKQQFGGSIRRKKPLTVAGRERTATDPGRRPKPQILSAQGSQLPHDLQPHERLRPLSSQAFLEGNCGSEVTETTNIQPSGSLPDAVDLHGVRKPQSGRPAPELPERLGCTGRQLAPSPHASIRSHCSSMSFNSGSSAGPFITPIDVEADTLQRRRRAPAPPASPTASLATGRTVGAMSMGTRLSQPPASVSGIIFHEHLGFGSEPTQDGTAASAQVEQLHEDRVTAGTTSATRSQSPVSSSFGCNFVEPTTPLPQRFSMDILSILPDVLETGSARGSVGSIDFESLPVPMPLPLNTTLHPGCPAVPVKDDEEESFGFQEDSDEMPDPCPAPPKSLVSALATTAASTSVHSQPASAKSPIIPPRPRPLVKPPPNTVLATATQACLLRESAPRIPVAASVNLLVRPASLLKDTPATSQGRTFCNSPDPDFGGCDTAPAIPVRSFVSFDDKSVSTANVNFPSVPAGRVSPVQESFSPSLFVKITPNMPGDGETASIARVSVPEAAVATKIQQLTPMGLRASFQDTLALAETSRPIAGAGGVALLRSPPPPVLPKPKGKTAPREEEGLEGNGFTTPSAPVPVSTAAPLIVIPDAPAASAEVTQKVGRSLVPTVLASKDFTTPPRNKLASDETIVTVITPALEPLVVAVAAAAAAAVCCDAFRANGLKFCGVCGQLLHILPPPTPDVLFAASEPALPSISIMANSYCDLPPPQEDIIMDMLPPPPPSLIEDEGELNFPAPPCTIVEVNTATLPPAATVLEDLPHLSLTPAVMVEELRMDAFLNLPPPPSMVLEVETGTLPVPPPELEELPPPSALILMDDSSEETLQFEAARSLSPPLPPPLPPMPSVEHWRSCGSMNDLLGSLRRGSSAHLLKTVPPPQRPLDPRDQLLRLVRQSSKDVLRAVATDLGKKPTEPRDILLAAIQQAAHNCPLKPAPPAPAKPVDPLDQVLAAVRMTTKDALKHVEPSQRAPEIRDAMINSIRGCSSKLLRPTPLPVTRPPSPRGLLLQAICTPSSTGRLKSVEVQPTQVAASSRTALLVSLGPLGRGTSSLKSVAANRKERKATAGDAVQQAISRALDGRREALDDEGNIREEDDDVWD